jgi:predicted DNA-binding ribbon-helix-helix protein
MSSPVSLMADPTPDYAPPRKRSVLIAGHQTSISLEPMFWRALEAAARERGSPLNALVAEIDVARLDADQPPNLTSAIRQWLFERSAGSLG